MPDNICGFLLVLLAGTLAGTFSSPIKLMKHFGYEHWGLIYIVSGMITLPWLIMGFSTDITAVFSAISWIDLLKGNLFSMAWGIANTLAGLCLLRIGFSLSIGLLTGGGLPIGVLIPMLFRGSGLFADAPGLFS